VVLILRSKIINTIAAHHVPFCERDRSGTTEASAKRAAKVMERIARREPQKKRQHFLSAAVFFVREAARPTNFASQNLIKN
jgi:hypothetical protein